MTLSSPRLSPRSTRWLVLLPAFVLAAGCMIPLYPPPREAPRRTPLVASSAPPAPPVRPSAHVDARRAFALGGATHPGVAVDPSALGR